MAETKYGKYIVTEPKANIAKPPWSPEMISDRAALVAYLDSEVVEGAFYMECVWIWPRPADELGRGGPKAHTHDYDEILGFFGTDREDPHDLCGEVELWLEDEKHILTKSCVVFIPKGMKHCPLIFTRVDRPIFHYSVGPGRMYF